MKPVILIVKPNTPTITGKIKLKLISRLVHGITRYTLFINIGADATTSFGSATYRSRDVIARAIEGMIHTAGDFGLPPYMLKKVDEQLIVSIDDHASVFHILAEIGRTYDLSDFYEKLIAHMNPESQQQLVDVTNTHKAPTTPIKKGELKHASLFATNSYPPLTRRAKSKMVDERRPHTAPNSPIIVR